MEFTIYFFTTVVMGFLFSFVTSMLLVFGIEQTGGDPGTPAIMLVSLMCICGILSVITASIMSWVKAKYKKEFPAKYSVLIFIVMYLPFHIIGIYFPDAQSEILAIIITFMLFLSFVPLFHATAQALINVYEFFAKRKNLAS